MGGGVAAAIVAGALSLGSPGGFSRERRHDVRALEPLTPSMGSSWVGAFQTAVATTAQVALTCGMRRFRDRVDAGVQLAEKLAAYAERRDVLVLALPRGGVPVAYEVARRLRAPLDLLVVRKLGLPSHPELAIGAIARGGVKILEPRVSERFGLSPADIAAVVRRETAELHRREALYRGDRPFPDLRGRTVLLVDDGIATGSTMRAAVAVVAGNSPASIVVAAPTMAAETARDLARSVDDVVSVVTPKQFGSVGEWYEEFSQTTDGDVKRLLEASDGDPASADQEG